MEYYHSAYGVLTSKLGGKGIKVPREDKVEDSLEFSSRMNSEELGDLDAMSLSSEAVLA